MKIRIKAMTEKGEDAIKQHVAESLTMGRLKRMALKKMGIHQEITSFSPYTLFLEIKGGFGAMMKKEHLKMEIEGTLKKNGATINEDYTIEIE